MQKFGSKSYRLVIGEQTLNFWGKLGVFRCRQEMVVKFFLVKLSGSIYCGQLKKIPVVLKDA